MLVQPVDNRSISERRMSSIGITNVGMQVISGRPFAVNSASPDEATEDRQTITIGQPEVPEDGKLRQSQNIESGDL